MIIRCKIGIHDWSNDCAKCSRCGKTRNKQHDWSKNCEKCANCNYSRENVHEWAKCKCTKCETTRNEEHTWNLNKCINCGITKKEAIIKDLLVAKFQEMADICNTPHSDILLVNRLVQKSVLSEAQKKYFEKLIENANIEKKRIEEKKEEKYEKIASKYGISIKELFSMWSDT
jgi:polyhydroxyalkanoate synthesis regulator phasin